MSSTSQGVPVRRSKRHHDGQEGPGMAVDNNKSVKRRRFEGHDANESHKLFACPYYKRCPSRWDKPPCRSREGWKNVARLKQHLQETHFKQICERCCELFETETELKAHAMSKEGCEPKEEDDFIRGFGASIQEKLRSRKMGRGLSQFEYWQKVYTTLFPDVSPENVPSPYCTPFNVHDWHHQCRDHRMQDRHLMHRLHEISRSSITRELFVKSILSAIDESDLSLIRMDENECPAKKGGSLSMKSDTSPETHLTASVTDLEGDPARDDNQASPLGRLHESEEVSREQGMHLEASGLQMVSNPGPPLMEQRRAEITTHHDFSFIKPHELFQHEFHHFGLAPDGRQNEFPTMGSLAQNNDTSLLNLQYSAPSPQNPFLPWLQEHELYQQEHRAPPGLVDRQAFDSVPRQDAVAALSHFKAVFEESNTKH